MQTGKDLKLRRVAMDVPANALADRLGVAASQISRWENSRVVTDEASTKYLEGLATFGTIPTVTSAQAVAS